MSYYFWLIRRHPVWCWNYMMYRFTTPTPSTAWIRLKLCAIYKIRILPCIYDVQEHVILGNQLKMLEWLWSFQTPHKPASPHTNWPLMCPFSLESKSQKLYIQTIIKQISNIQQLSNPKVGNWRSATIKLLSNNYLVKRMKPLTHDYPETNKGYYRTIESLSNIYPDQRWAAIKPLSNKYPDQRWDTKKSLSNHYPDQYGCRPRREIGEF